MKRLHCILFATGLALCITTSALADNIGITLDKENTLGAPGDGGFTYGWKFTIEQPIKITELGTLDKTKNLTIEHFVAIWDLSVNGGRKVSGTVPKGVAADNMHDGLFSFVDIKDVVLDKGSYIVASYYAENEDFISREGAEAKNLGAGITYGGGFLGVGDFKQPTKMADTEGIFGGNFRYTTIPNGPVVPTAQPEPGTWLTGVALTCMIGFCRKRRVA